MLFYWVAYFGLSSDWANFIRLCSCLGRLVIGKIRQRFDTVVGIGQGTDFPYSKMHEAYPQNGRVGRARLLFAVAHDSRYLHHAADNNQPLGAVSLVLDTANDAVG